MTPEQLKEARLKLGLSVIQLADMLGLSHQHARRLTVDPNKKSSRRLDDTAARLLQAYLDGYRPADWPHR